RRPRFIHVQADFLGVPGATAVTRAAEEDIVPPVTAVVPDHEGFAGWAHRDRQREGVRLQVILQMVDTRGSRPRDAAVGGAHREETVASRSLVLPDDEQVLTGPYDALAEHRLALSAQFEGIGPRVS